ncbi:MAG: homoserine kinase [Aquabacterium sp.]
MAVFTEVDPSEADALTQRLGLGPLRSLEGIAAGIENTNYFVGTDGGRWVLTLFERMDDARLQFCLGLMKHLAGDGLPVPEPVAAADGALCHQVAGKPAALVRRLDGDHIEAPDLHHAAAVGQMLARLHLSAQRYTGLQPNPRGLAWCATTAAAVDHALNEGQRGLLRSEVVWQQALTATPAHAALPRAAMHGDLFRDNVLFAGLPGRERLSGCFDFYFAGVEALAWDLAVVLNDWALDDATGALDADRADTLTQAYQTVRPLQSGEIRLLPALLRAAALRFWVSRLADLHLPREAALLNPKDPGHFERVLRSRIAQPWHPQPVAEVPWA